MAEKACPRKKTVIFLAVGGSKSSC